MWVLLAFLAVPLIEIGLFVTLGAAIGLWPTLAWVVVSAVLGLVVLKGIAETGSVMLSQNLQEMADPLSPIAHRAMVALAGGLLVLPGFLTDFIGLLLLIPPLRGLIMKLVARRFAARATVIHGTVIDADWREVTPGEPPADPGRPGNPPSQRTQQ